MTLGTEALDAGINTVDISAVGAGNTVNINASAFGAPLTIIDGSGDNTIVGPNSDPLTLQLGGGTDDVTTGSA